MGPVPQVGDITRVLIKVTRPGQTTTAGQAADLVVADAQTAIPDVQVKRTETRLGGVEAVMLDGFRGRISTGGCLRGARRAAV